MKDKISKAADLLLDPPVEGIHGWIFGRAIFLRNRYDYTSQETVEIIQAKIDRSNLRRVVEFREILDSVQNAYSHRNDIETSIPLLRNQNDIVQFKEEWPESMPLPKIPKDRRKISDIIRERGPWEIQQIISESPISISGLNSREVLSYLFDKEDLLCTGVVSRFNVSKLSKIKSFAEQIVPNPNRKKLARTKNGRLSGHCRAAVGKRKFLVIEFDDEKLLHNQQSSLIRYLNKFVGGDLRMIVNSGGKSLHAWFKASKDEVLNWKFMNLAVSIGADPRMWLPEQFARTPNALRSNGNTQQCLFLKA